MSNETKILSFWHPATLLGTWFGAGLSPWAPGTVGSAAAIPFAWAIAQFFGGMGLLVATVICFFVGWWACAVYCGRTHKQDPGEMVIDEVAGMWLLIAGFTLWMEPLPVIGDYGHPMHYFNNVNIIPLLAVVYATIFFVFRFFDIWKPWPIRWVDRNIKGGLGVMLDDILAAIFSVVPVFFIVIYYLGSQGAFS